MHTSESRDTGTNTGDADIDIRSRPREAAANHSAVNVKMFGKDVAHVLHGNHLGRSPHSKGKSEHCHHQRAMLCGQERRICSTRHIEKLVSSCSARQQHTVHSNRLSASQGHAVRPSSYRSDSAVRASVSGTSTEEAPGLAVVQADDSCSSAPILSGAGGGIFFWWQLGDSLPALCAFPPACSASQYKAVVRLGSCAGACFQELSNTCSSAMT